MLSSNSKLLQELTNILNDIGSSHFCERLSRVVKRQGGFTRLAKETSLNRESLYKALSGKRDPRFSTVVEALSALGMRFRVEVDRDILEAELAGLSGFEGAWLDLYLLSPEERLRKADEAVERFNDLSIINAKD